MNILGTIIKILNFNLDKEYDANIIKKIQFLNIFSLIGIPFLIIYLIIEIITSVNNTIIITVPMIFVMLGNFIYLAKSKNYKHSIVIATISYSIFLLMILLNGNFKSAGILWFYPFPIFISQIFNFKKGTIFSLISVIIIILVFYLPLDFIINYDMNLKLRFLSSYSIIILIIFMIELINEKTRKEIEHELLTLQQSCDKKTELISSMSFQTRSKLNSLLGYTDFLENTELNERQLDYVEIIKASVYNISATIDYADSISRQNNKEENRKFKFNIIESLYKIIDFYNIKITVYQNSSVHYKLSGNPIKFKQIFLNIFDVLTQNKSKQIQININIDKTSKLNQITNIEFDITSDCFIDIDDVNQIELLLTKSLIKQCNGVFSIISNDNYTKIRISIPFENEINEQLKITKNTENTEKNTLNTEKIPLQDAKILLIEDDEINQQIITIGLKKHVKTIDVADNGKEALYLYENTKYHLIIMDLQMPIMDGFKTTKKIREVEITTSSYTPIIALTANTVNYNKTTCVEAGMNEYIAKPFKMSELLKTIENLIC